MLRFRAEPKRWISVTAPVAPSLARWGKQVRFDKIAEAYGAHGEYVERREDIVSAVERALASGIPAVVQIPVNSEINALEVPGFEEFATWYGDKGYQ